VTSPFRRGEWGAGTHHLHIYALGSFDFENLVLFRDHLRSHPESAAAYERLKRELAATAPDRQSYTDLKRPFIESVLSPYRSQIFGPATGQPKSL
jgi:GrpB-like predicted nucleotidyltransferase (UPF0157 family)